MSSCCDQSDEQSKDEKLPSYFVKPDHPIGWKIRPSTFIFIDTKSQETRDKDEMD